MKACWTPNAGSQAAFCRDFDHAITALEGGFGAGKTWSGARKLITIHAHNAFDDRNQPTGVPSAVGAPTYGNLADINVPAIEQACREAGLSCIYRGSGAVHKGKFSAPAFLLPDLSSRSKPSVILLRSADNPSRIAGWEAGCIWLDEPARFDVDKADPLRDPLLQFLGRLRHPRARLLRLLMTYTNEGDSTRVYEMMREGKSDRKLYTASTVTNKHVPQAYLDWLAALPPDLQAQYRDGGAISLRGKRLYPCFAPERNIDPGLKLIDGLDLHIAVDFNINPGMHVLIGQQLVDGTLTCVHEIHGPGMSVRDVGPVLGKVVAENGGIRKGSILRWPEIHVFGDASGNSRWSGTGETNYQILRQELDRLEVPYRVRVPDANPPVIDRLNAFNSAMHDVDGRVSWKCHPRCERLVADLRDMKRDRDGQIDKRDADLSHASDAEGYRVYRLRPIRRPVIRPEDQIISV